MRRARARTINREVSVVLKSGKEVTTEVSATFVHDPDYGADADGNRGVPMDFVDDIDFTVPDVDNDSATLTHEEKREADELFTKAVGDLGCADDYDDYDDYYD